MPFGRTRRVWQYIGTNPDVMLGSWVRKIDVAFLANVNATRVNQVFSMNEI